MRTKEAASRLGCAPVTIHMLIKRGKLERVSLHEVSDESVLRYAATRRLKRKTSDTGFIGARHMPQELLRRFRAAVPGGSSLGQCLIEAIEMWLKGKE